MNGVNTPGNADWMPDFEDPEKPQRLDRFYPSDATACSPSLADRLRLSAYAKRSTVEAIHNEAANEIERLRGALLEIAKRGANPMTGYGYGVDLPWPRLADDVWRIARESLENVRPLAPADNQTPNSNGQS